MTWEHDGHDIALFESATHKRGTTWEDGALIGDYSTEFIDWQGARDFYCQDCDRIVLLPEDLEFDYA